MTITIDAQDLLLILLNGNLCDSVAIPKNIVSPLRGHSEIVIEDEGDAAAYVTIWSVFGWENEQRRRSYFSCLRPLPRPTAQVPAPKKKIDLSEYS